MWCLLCFKSVALSAVELYLRDGKDSEQQEADCISEFCLSFKEAKIGQFGLTDAESLPNFDCIANEPQNSESLYHQVLNILKMSKLTGRSTERELEEDICSLNSLHVLKNITY